MTVELILRKLGEGAMVAELLDGYPQLKKEDIQAAMAYAADTLVHDGKVTAFVHQKAVTLPSCAHCVPPGTT